MSSVTPPVSNSVLDPDSVQQLPNENLFEVSETGKRTSLKNHGKSQ